MLDRLSFKDIPTVTLVLVAISVLTYLAWLSGMDRQIRTAFFISAYRVLPGFETLGNAMPEVMQGQVWRLVTPVFIHFSIMHIVFNMLCMLVLAGPIEKKYGKTYFILMVLVIAVVSNVAQLMYGGSYFTYGGPRFGGMSGVVYGIFGYLWMQSKFNPWSGLMIHDQEIMFIMIWFVACWLGLLGPIANMAHTVGLLGGLAWGYGHATYVNHRRKR